MRAIDKCGAVEKRSLQQVQRGTDTRIPVALVKQPTGEPLDPATLEGLAIKVENEGGALSAEPPYTIEGGQLIVEVTKEISESLGVGVYTLKATGRLADPSYEDGYHDYTIMTELCRVVRDAVLYTPTAVTANVLEGLKGKDGLDNYQIAVKHGYQGTEEDFAKALIPKSNYERAKEIKGFQGSEEDYLDSLHGATGESIYEMAKRNGFVGSEDEYLKSQKGKSAYQSYLDTTTDDPKLTEAQWATINATTTQYLYRINKGKEAPMNEQTLSADQLMELDRHRRNIIKALRDKGVQVSDDEGLETLDRKISEMKAYAPIIFKAQQFLNWNDKEFPTMQLSESYRPADLNYCFARNHYLKELPTVRGLENASNLNSFVNGCSALTNVSLPDLPIAQTTSSIFYECPSLESATIGSMPKTMDTSELFRGCGALITATIGATPKVASTRLMFFNCAALKSVSLDLSGGSITNSEYMFSGCSVLTTVSGVIDLTSTTKVTGMFNGCSSLEEVRIKGLKTSLDLSVCVNISMESARYLIENLQTAKSQRIDLPRKLLEANEEALGDLGDTASDKGWTINYK